VTAFLILLFIHWIADFVAQTNWQASNKSKRWDALCAHVSVYTLILSIGVDIAFPGAPWGLWFEFLLVNSVLHLATDFVTSRISSKLFVGQFESFDIVMAPPLAGPIDPPRKESRVLMKKDFSLHNFFVVVGFDQFIHQITLALTVKVFFWMGLNLEQHNHHCLVTFMGIDWRIWRVRRHLIDCAQLDHPFGYIVTIDIADVDFDAYCTAAAAWDDARERA